MPKPEFNPASEVSMVVQTLVREFHPHLVRTRVECWFTDKEPDTSAAWGHVKLVTGLAARLAGQNPEDGDETEFFLLTVSKPVWNTLSPEKRRALVDHLLCHCWIEETAKGNPKAKVVKHDLEEFVQVIQRHGLWRDDVTKFVEVGSQCLQSSLFESPDAVETSGDRNAQRGAIGPVDATFANASK
jgi:hypothetical protein